MTSATSVARAACLGIALGARLTAACQAGAGSAVAFDSVSVRRAAPEAPTAGTGFMIDLGRQVAPRGLLTMTSPLAPLLMFAYDVEDEVEARAMRARLPEWAQREKFTIVARPPMAAPNIEELRVMLRALLEDRFAVKAHRQTHPGRVNDLLVINPGSTGPGLKPHDPADACIPRGGSPNRDAQAGVTPSTVYCGFDLRSTPDGLLHISMVDVTLAQACTLLGGLGGVLGGRGMDPVIDSTGLAGRWDFTLVFLPERSNTGSESSQGALDAGGPSFTAALEQQLGLRLKKGTGPVEELMIDHIAQPSPDE